MLLTWAMITRRPKCFGSYVGDQLSLPNNSHPERPSPALQCNLSHRPSIDLMSSSGHPTSSFLPSNFQLIADALANYCKQTGIDLSKNPLTEKLQLSKSPDDILQLLREREKDFKEYRDRNRTLIACLRPAVNVLDTFSAILGKTASLVSHTCLVNILVSATALFERFNSTSPDPLPSSNSCHCWH